MQKTSACDVYAAPQADDSGLELVIDECMTAPNGSEGCELGYLSSLFLKP